MDFVFLAFFLMESRTFLSTKVFSPLTAFLPTFVNSLATSFCTVKERQKASFANSLTQRFGAFCFGSLYR